GPRRNRRLVIKRQCYRAVFHQCRLCRMQARCERDSARCRKIVSSPYPEEKFSFLDEKREAVRCAALRDNHTVFARGIEARGDREGPRRDVWSIGTFQMVAILQRKFR